ncbi:MAG: hydroxymethylpyrimidine transporter CytX [Deltaproteobacteria bacterium RBG_19FT_COMBO_46_12]|nr:MAG: hydroxymethylpyrimidine transporter CytX [Deltaproteobacteria bacterium RBG_19FT_COMBO_46_12]
MAGIQPIPKEERNLGGWDFFLLWAGAATSLAEIWAGGLIVPLGLGLGLWAILLGHLIGNTPFALGGLIGSRWGIPTMVSVRPSFGIRGSYFAAALNVIQLIGWTAVMLIVCGQAADAISKFYGFSNLNLWIILSGIITTLWAVVGHRIWKWLQRIAVFALLILCIAMTYVVFQQYGWGMLSQIPRKKDFPFMVGMDLIIAMPISWLPLVSDYSRFAKDSKSSFWGTWISYFIVSSWMYLIGLMASLATQSPDPSGVVMSLMLKFGWAIPALIIVLFSTFTTTFLDIYSTAISGLNIFPKLGERKGVIIGGILGTTLAIIFPTLLDYEHFLLFIGAMFCPLFGIVLVDYFLLRKGSIHVEDLYRPGSQYWFKSGVNPNAIIAWATGFAIYLGFSPMLMEKVLQIKAAFPWPIGSSLPSMALAGLIYWSMSQRRGSDDTED